MSQLRPDAPLSQAPIKPSPARDRADFAALDVDASAQLSPDEFLGYGKGLTLAGADKLAYEQKRLARFERYDADQSGSVSQDEFVTGRQADRAPKTVASPKGLGALLKGALSWLRAHTHTGPMGLPMLLPFERPEGKHPPFLM